MRTARVGEHSVFSFKKCGDGLETGRDAEHVWGNEADVRQGARVLWGKVLEVRLEERAVLAVEAAFVWRGVSPKDQCAVGPCDVARNAPVCK